jgi:hypothetical protein
MLDRLLARWRAHRPLFRAGTPAPVEDVNSPWRHLTRAPLLDRSGGIVGWHLRPIAAGSTNPTALGMAQAALASAARTLTSRGATVITPLPAGPLERGPLAQLGGGCIVEVSDAHLALFKTGLAATVAALRARDIEIATAQRAIALLVPPDWIVIDARGRSAAAALGEYRQFMLKRRWVALGLRSLAQVHAALGAGASLASGTFEVSARALQADQSEPGPSFAHAASLLRAVLEGKSVRALATLAAADPATAYRVLRATNGSIHQWGYERGSLQDALRTWDAQERFRRACALVLTAANERPYVRALQEVALTRARLFEWIALLRKDTGATAPALFATGAFSLLGPILDAAASGSDASVAARSRPCHAARRRGTVAQLPRFGRSAGKRRGPCDRKCRARAGFGCAARTRAARRRRRVGGRRDGRDVGLACRRASPRSRLTPMKVIGATASSPRAPAGAGWARYSTR